MPRAPWELEDSLPGLDQPPSLVSSSAVYSCLLGRDWEEHMMYKRGKALFEALTRIPGIGDNGSLHFLGKRKILH